MAKNINQILQELGLDKATDIDSLIDRLDTVADSEINAIKSISVKTLPTTVANQEEAVKRRMYGVVTDEDKGAVSLINKRTAIIHKLLELLREEKDTDVEGIYNRIIKITETLDKTDTAITNLNKDVSDKANESYVKQLEERVEYLEKEKNTTVGTVVDDTLVLFNAAVVGDTLVIKDGYVTSDEEGNQTLHIGGLYD